MTNKIAKPTRKPRRNVIKPFQHECPRLVLARRLELLAGCELQHGHIVAAEHLSRRAAEMRETGR